MLPLELIFQRSANGGGSFRWYHADSIHEKISLLDLERTSLKRAKKVAMPQTTTVSPPIRRSGPVFLCLSGRHSRIMDLMNLNPKLEERL